MGGVCTKNTGVREVAIKGATERIPTSNPILFIDLSDDVLLVILSYVSYAPTELDVIGTLSLSYLENFESKADHKHVKHLLQDYNRASKKRKWAGLSPIRPPLRYYSSESLQAFDEEDAHNSLGRTARSRSHRVTAPRTFGTLTHVLPLVNKQLYQLCNNSEILWKESLERLMGLNNSCTRPTIDIGSCDLWEKGVISFIEQHHQTSGNPHVVSLGVPDETNIPRRQMNEEEKIKKLISNACNLVQTQRRQDQHHPSPSKKQLPRPCSGREEISAAQEVFRQVLARFKSIRLPAFIMPARSAIKIGSELQMNFHEPRYRLLIAEAMAGRPQRERRGSPIVTPRPKFLLACNKRAFITGACVAEIKRCTIHTNGTADVMIVPVSWVIYQNVTIRPESGDLTDAAVRIPARTNQRKWLPMFHLRCPAVSIGTPVELRFFETRYLTLIAEALVNRTESELNGSLMEVTELCPRHRFVYAFDASLESVNQACIVELQRCRMHNDGSADVTFVPLSWVLIDHIKMRPNSGRLCDGRLFDATFLTV